MFLFGISSVYGVDALLEFEEYKSIIDNESFELLNEDKSYNKMLLTLVDKYRIYLNKNIQNANVNINKSK